MNATHGNQINPLGDSALVVRLGDDFGSDPETALKSVSRGLRQLEAAAIPGVIECAPAFNSIGVFFDPVRAASAGAPVGRIVEWLEERIRAALVAGGGVVAGSGPGDNEHHQRVVEIPVCYEAEFAPDLEEVARHAGLTAAEAVQRHSAAAYLVQCVGFVPGFPYLSGLPAELAIPRRATPRKHVPSGAVGIGGSHTGIYPVDSPGGWNIIGRTPISLFDVGRDPPALLRAGDRVSFRAITREEFQSLPMPSRELH